SVSLAHDVEVLQQRHAGFHHGRKLPGKERDVLVGDLAAAEALPLDLAYLDALPPQRRVDLSFPRCAHFAAHRLAGFVLTYPGEVEFFYPWFSDCRSGCRSHAIPLRFPGRTRM